MKTELMGILNVTPDSFFAGSRKQTEHEIATRANQIALEGGTMIDVGAMSTRPGHEDVSEEEEMRRLRFALPIIKREQPDMTLSVDTFRPLVARMAVEEFGVDIINDVSEGPMEMLEEVARLRVPYILMSVQPDMERTISVFREKIEILNDMGHDNVILDPGYGFGKDVAQNYAMLNRQEELLQFGKPLLVGISRKRMIYQLLNSSADEALNGTTVVNTLALERGASILRVHDVRQAAEAISIVNALKSSRLGS